MNEKNTPKIDTLNYLYTKIDTLILCNTFLKRILL
jgi:hypothetical protein